MSIYKTNTVNPTKQTPSTVNCTKKMAFYRNKQSTFKTNKFNFTQQIQQAVPNLLTDLQHKLRN